MSEIDADVFRGLTWTADQDDRVRVTKDRLNMAALPRVTVDLNSAIDAEDLNDSVAQLLGGACTFESVTVTEPETGEFKSEIVIVLNDAKGNPMDRRTTFRWWYSLTESGGPIPPTGDVGALKYAVVPTADAVMLGDSISGANKTFGECMTSATGYIKMDLTQESQTDGYLYIDHQGVISFVQLFWVP